MEGLPAPVGPSFVMHGLPLFPWLTMLNTFDLFQVCSLTQTLASSEVTFFSFKYFPSVLAYWSYIMVLHTLIDGNWIRPLSTVTIYSIVKRRSY